ncbi:hypothetical protein EDB86DRAFT_2970029 [Lactarius hatsudake]|nr:hypothetical protein EDB86DRAFT_2970029 [Lactarius hatsudake]
MARGKARLTVIYSSLLSVFTNQLKVRWCIRKHAGVSRASDVLATAFWFGSFGSRLAAQPGAASGSYQGQPTTPRR